jgi:formiminotetrahydrofolate cyclodeaminase
MRELLRLEPVLHDAADRDVAAFDRYLRARRLTEDNVVEARIREKAIEEALVTLPAFRRRPLPPSGAS